MANFDGKHSEHRLEQNKSCRYCHLTGYVYYIGSEVTHGNPYSPASDTDVEHYYICESCGKEWTEYA